MKSEKTLTEAHNYLVYIADALYSISQKFNTDKADRVALEKYAQDLFAYAQGLDKLKTSMKHKEQLKKQEFDKDTQAN